MIIGTGTDLSYLNYGRNDYTGQVTLSQVVTNNDVTDMRYSYANCSYITSVVAYEYAYRTNVTYIAYSYDSSYISDNIEYKYKYNFESYTYTNEVTNFKQAKTGFVKNMSHMFANCYSLTEANLAYMDFSECTNMQGMFDNCYNLKTVVFGRYACNALLHLQDIFSGCYSLDRVYVPFELKDDFSNIIGHAGLHSYFYNANYNIEDTLPIVKDKYWFSDVTIGSTYTTLTVNKIGAFIVEADYDYQGGNECVLDIYANSSYDDTYKLMFSYVTGAPIDRSALETSDIAEQCSYRFMLADKFNLKADLSVITANNKTYLESISYQIDNFDNSRYIDVNTYLIYFSDNEEGSPEIDLDPSLDDYKPAYLSKNTIIASTYDWFFSDIKRVKYLDTKTFTNTYSYESSFDTYAYVTYKDPETDTYTGVYDTLLTLNNKLDDDYEGSTTDYPVSVGYVFVKRFGNE